MVGVDAEKFDATVMMSAFDEVGLGSTQGGLSHFAGEPHLLILNTGPNHGMVVVAVASVFDVVLSSQHCVVA